MVVLTVEEREEMCRSLARHLPKIRALLHLSQKEFGERCGISKERLTRIECGHFVMTWSQLTSIMFLTVVNSRTKEYVCANRIFSPRFLQYLQQKEENIPPDSNIVVRDDLLMSYNELLEYNRRHPVGKKAHSKKNDGGDNPEEET